MKTFGQQAGWPVALVAAGAVLALACAREPGSGNQAAARGSRDQAPVAIAVPRVGGEEATVAFLTISPAGALSLDGQPVTADRLEERLARRLGGRESGMLVIGGAKELWQRAGIDVMAIAKRAGVNNISIPTARP